MVSSYCRQDKQIYHRSVNACLFPLCSVAGLAVTTIEGLGSVDKVKIIRCKWITMWILYTRSHPNATKHDIEENFDGNLCRCTGYRPILDSAKSFGIDEPECSKELKEEIEKPFICPSSGKPCDCKNKTVHIPSKPLDLTSEPIFPPFLMSFENPSLKFVGDRVTWYTPTTLNELLTLKSQNQNAKIIVGNTEVGIEVKFKNVIYPVLINPTMVPEMNTITKTETGIVVGASATLTKFKTYLMDLIKNESESKTKTFKSIISQLKLFAGNQIRNAACIAGNLITASPISDLNPVLLAAGAELTMLSINEQTGEHVKRVVHISNFFLKYRIVDIQPNEILYSVHIPFTRELEFVEAYKQSRRRDDDIAIVSCCFRVLLEKEESQKNQFKVKECVLAYGGMNIKAVTAPKTQQLLLNSIWDRKLLDPIYLTLADDLPLAAGAPGGMIEYRRSLTTSFFFKFFLSVNQKLYEITENDPSYSVDKRELSAFEKHHRPTSHGEQTYQTQPHNQPVSMPIKHQSADKQVTGEAIYTDDIQMKSLYAAIVPSSKAHAKIKSINPEKALSAPGVKGFYCAKDIPGINQCGPYIVQDEELFASEIVEFVGHPIGVVIAETHQQALEAARLVAIDYEELPHVITIEDAIEKNSFLNLEHVIIDGDIEKGFKESDYVIEGQMKVGGQEHFYLETNASLVIPGEGKELMIWSSTQNPTKTQNIVAKILGIQANQVVVKVKRMGGGFGGKETRSIFASCIAAIGAVKLKQPVRIVLDRDTDMVTTGFRHPFLGKYKIGFDKNGLIKSADVHLFANAGYSFELSVGVLDRAIFHSENAYKIPNVRVVGKLCKTNTPTNTAFRGFGGPQGMIICENWVERISSILNIPSYKIRVCELTFYQQPVLNSQMHKLWNEMMQKSNYVERIKSVQEFNDANRWKKRGIALIPTKFGMSFTIKLLNQGGALVHVYTDGSVLVTHGGTEMGQGLHTKMIQIAARELGVPVENVHISETATDKVANTAPTAASVSSDINGMAVLDACQQINARLQPLREKNPDMTFKQLAMLAFAERINLSANGFYATPNVGYDFRPEGKGVGTPFNYYSFGASCSEVEIDTLTGDYTILRSDVILDVGNSLNPTIDIGQVEGAFVQGVGWCTLEELVTFPSGYLFTRGPSTYKIPGFSDIPLEFNVSLLSDSPNPKAIHSSKGVGEPPLFLGSSVFFAIRDAILSSRKESGLENSWFDLESPATCERIRNACVDRFTMQFNNKN
uniref:Xanthine dehydrogenase n=1 Tax=Coremiostelium polycephalum TaxID=142831 RepID=A0A1L2FUW7_9MYCE|nr:xanthine dehydrogenase [Coremiostelium polycephalum]